MASGQKKMMGHQNFRGLIAEQKIWAVSIVVRIGKKERLEGRCKSWKIAFGKGETNGCILSNQNIGTYNQVKKIQKSYDREKKTQVQKDNTLWIGFNSIHPFRLTFAFLVCVYISAEPTEIYT